MAKITALLQLNENGADRVDSVSSPFQVNNVSKPLGWNNTTRSKGANAIVIGAGEYKIGADGWYLLPASGYNGYRFNAITDADGYAPDIKLVFTGENIDSLTIYGDEAANQYPTLVVLDEGEDGEKSVSSDDLVLSVVFDEPAASHSVTIKRWNRPYYNPCITYIEIFPAKISFDKYWINTVESDTSATNDASGLFYGVIPNTGHIELVDYNGELSDYSRGGFLNKDVFTLDIFYNGKLLQSHTASDSPYFDAQGQFDITVTNPLAKWQDAKYGGYTVLNGATITAYALLSHMLMNSEGSTYTQADVDMMLQTEINVGDSEMTVEEYLQSIVIPGVSGGLQVRASSLYAAVNKICTLAQLQVYAKDDGQVTFANARPLATAEELGNVIVIPSRLQFSSFDYNILLTNAYTQVSITEA